MTQPDGTRPPGRIRGALSVEAGPQQSMEVSREVAALLEGRQFLFGLVRITEFPDAGEGRVLPFVTSMTIPGLVPDSVYTADVTTWVDDDGQPVAEGGKPAMRDGEPATGTFCYIVSFNGPARHDGGFL